MEQVKSICGLCNCECGIIAWVDGGRLVKIEGDPASPLNRGALCAKGRALKQLVYDPDRILEPMRRTRSGSWEKVGWEAILDEIAGRISRLREQYGPDSLALYEGTIAKTNISWLNKDFLYGLGSPNYTSTWSLCVSPRDISSGMVFGPGMAPVCDYPQAQCILLFGANPAATGMHRYLRLMDDIIRARQNGAKLIVVDPRPTETARQADLWIPVRPGTDLALVMGLIRVIVEEKLFNEAFVERHCEGFDRLREELSSYPLDRVSEVTGISTTVIRQAARYYATAGPACADRREGVMHQRQATLVNRAILVLSAICGNVDITGGICFRPPFPLASTRPAPEREHLAYPEFPFANAAAYLPAASHRIKALVTVMGNPVSAWPNTRRVLSFLEQLELLVCIDLYLNETADRAHYFLPGVTGLERCVLSYSRQMPVNLVRFGPGLIEPEGGSRPEDEIIIELGKRLQVEGFSELATGRDVINRILSPSGYSVDALAADQNGIVYAGTPPGSFRRDGFPTASGKIRLCPDELFRFTRGNVSGAGPPDPSYPYLLVAGFRLPMHYNSAVTNLPWLHQLYPRHQAEISGDIAAARGIGDDDLVEITTAVGSIRLSCRVVESQAPGTVAVPHGFGGKHGQVVKRSGGANVNLLTADVFDPVSATPSYRDQVCNVTRLPNPARLRLKEGKCIGCLACVVACQSENNLPPGVRYLALEIRDNREYLAVCRQCARPECTRVCRAGAWKRQGGVAVLLEERCTGCRACLESCPYHAVRFNFETGKVGKCSLCLASGGGSVGSQPECVKSCPTGALYVE